MKEIPQRDYDRDTGFYRVDEGELERDIIDRSATVHTNTQTERLVSRIPRRVPDRTSFTSSLQPTYSLVLQDEDLQP